MRTSHFIKIPKPKAKNTICGCGGSVEDGYTVEVKPDLKTGKVKHVSLCCECYERYVRNLKYRKSITCSMTKGYYK